MKIVTLISLLRLLFIPRIFTHCKPIIVNMYAQGLLGRYPFPPSHFKRFKLLSQKFCVFSKLEHHPCNFSRMNVCFHVEGFLYYVLIILTVSNSGYNSPTGVTSYFFLKVCLSSRLRGLNDILTLMIVANHV